MGKIAYKDTVDVIDKLMAEFGDLFAEVVVDIQTNVKDIQNITIVEMMTILFPKIKKYNALKKITAIFLDKQPNEVKITELFGMVGFIVKTIRESMDVFYSEAE